MINALFKKHFFLILIVLVSTALHFYKLGEVPKILNPDEASIAYNAFLLKETGKDEWGKQWPLVLDAFGDQKLIGYPALVVGVFHLIGYSDWAVKIPSLIAGSFLIVFIYVLELQVNHSRKQAVVAALLVGLIPVFFFYSRVAFEAMVALAYLVGGFSLLLEAKKNISSRKLYLLNFFAILLFVFALFTYNSPVILIPILLAAVIIDRGILNWKKWIGITSLLFLAWISFAVYFLPLTQQKSKITLFGDETTLNEFNEYRGHLTGPLKTLIGNKYVFYSDKMILGYLKSWSPGFLMNNVGGHPWHAVQGFGYLYWSVYFAGIIGVCAKIFFTLRDLKEESRRKKISILKYVGTAQFSKMTELAIFFIFIFSLAPVVITVNAPQATRSLLFFFLWSYFAAFGLFVFSKVIHIILSHYSKVSWFKSEIGNRVILGVFLFIVLLEAGNYMRYYFGTYANDNKLQSMFEPGLPEIIQNLDKQPTGPLAIVDERGFNYILVAWYLKLEPNFFFSTIKKQQPDKINFKYGEQVSKYHFIAKPIDRRPNEKTVLQWTYADSRWETLNY